MACFSISQECHAQCKTVHTHGMVSIVQYQQWPQKYLTMLSTTNMPCTASRITIQIEGTLKQSHPEPLSHTQAWHICLPFVRQ